MNTRLRINREINAEIITLEDTLAEVLRYEKTLREDIIALIGRMKVQAAAAQEDIVAKELRVNKMWNDLLVARELKEEEDYIACINREEKARRDYLDNRVVSPLVLVDEVSQEDVDFNAMMDNRFAFDSDSVCNAMTFIGMETVAPSYEVSNGINALANGTLVAYPCSLEGSKEADNTFTVDKALSNAHKKFVVDNELAGEDYSILGFNFTKGTTIIRIDNVETYRLVKRVFGTVSVGKYEFIDYSKASDVIDGFFFTKDFVLRNLLIDDVDALHGLNCAGQFLLFNQECCDVANAVDLKIDSELLVNWLKGKKSRMRIKEKQDIFVLRKISTDMLTWKVIEDKATGKPRQVLCIEKGSATRITMQRNRLLDRYGSVEKDVKGFRNADNFIVVNGAPQVPNKINGQALTKREKETLQKKYKGMTVRALRYEIYDEETDSLFHVCLQSASQARVGKYYFTSEDVMEVRNFMLCGYKFADMTSIAKMESRAGLGLTVAQVLDTNANVLEIEDYDYIGEIDSIQASKTGLDENGKVERSFYKNKACKTTPCDGQGTIRITYACKLAYRLGLLTKIENDYFLENYTNLADVRTNPAMLSIFDKIPTAYQIRNAGDKGLLAIYPHDEISNANGEFPYANYDVVMTASMRKYPLDDYSNITFEVANYNKPKKELVPLSYQFIGATGITGEELIELAFRTLDKLDKDITVNHKSALKYLGLSNIAMSDNVVEFEHDLKINSKLSEIIATNKDALKDKYVAKTLKKHLHNFISKIGFGKVLVEGDYYYLLTDPRFMFPETRDLALASGGFYLNGDTCECAGFRSPLIHKSEAQKFQLVECDELWFMRDIFIFNPFDFRLPALGGADTDGDIMLVTKEPLIVKNVQDCGYIIIDNGMAGQNAENSMESVINHYANNSEVSSIGVLTKYATVYRDLELSEGENHDDKIIDIRFLQGWEIDKPKTGFKNDFSDDYATDLCPHWLYAVKNDKRAANDKQDITPYVSKSPLGQLYDAVCKFEKEMLESEPTHNFTVDFASIPGVDVNLVYKLAEKDGDLAQLEASYRNEMRKIAIALDGSDELGEKEFNFDILYADFRTKILSLYSENATDKDFMLSLAVACYQVTYCKDTKSTSYSFPWTCFYEETLNLFTQLDNGMQLFSLPNELNEEAIEVVEVIETGMLKINGNILMSTTIPCGVYEVENIDGRNFIYAKRTNFKTFSAPTVLGSSDELFEVLVSGCEKYHGITSKESFKEIIQNDFTIQEVNGNYCVVVNGKTVGGLLKLSELVYGKVKGMKLTCINTLEDIKALDYTDKNGNEKTYASYRASIRIIGASSDEDLYVPATKEVYSDSEYINTTTGEITSIDSYAPYVENYDCDYDFEGYNYDEYSEIEEEVSNDQAIDEAIFSKMKTNVSYWEVKSLAPTKNIEKYSFEILNSSRFAKGTVVGTVTVTNDKATLTVNVIIGENGLEVEGNKGSLEFRNWVLRLISYNATVERLS